MLLRLGERGHKPRACQGAFSTLFCLNSSAEKVFDKWRMGNHWLGKMAKSGGPRQIDLFSDLSPSLHSLQWGLEMHEITSDAGQIHDAGGPSHALNHDPLEHLVEGRLNLDELAGAIGCDLRSLAHWAMQPENALTLAGLLRLADARTQLALGKYRMAAAVRLVRIISGEQSDTKVGDLMRKACVDLLTIESSLAPPGASSRSSASDGSDADPGEDPPAPMPEAIILALEALGRGEELD